MRRPIVLIAATSLAACASFGGPAVVPPVATLGPTAEITADSLLAISALCSAEALGVDNIAPDIKLSEGMGTGGFKVDTASAEAQHWFNYGLALSHAFYHQDVKAAMKRAVELDPACSLCSWGEAWALGPTLNYGIEDDERALALVAAVRAQSLVKPGDDLARRLADAMVARYAAPAPAPVAGEKKDAGKKTEDDGPSAEDVAKEGAFAHALVKIAADYPDMTELTVLAAHSLMMVERGEKTDDLKSALVLLEGVLKAHPNDTGAIHYYIHATEFDGRAEDALPYAKRLGALAPAASHLVHMPGHTFFRAGLYHEAAVVNARAIAMDATWIAGGGDPRPPMLKDFRLPMYYGHNLAFGLAGAMMSGDGPLALRFAEHATKAYPADREKMSRDPTPRTYVALARYAPDQMLALPPSARDTDYFRMYQAYGRGEAFLQKGDAASARIERDKLRKAIAGDDAEGKIALAVLEGRLAMAEGNTRAAIDRFSAGAVLQKKEFGTFMDPPTWWYPLRRSLAAAYLKAGEFAKAESEAKASLAEWKRDPLALWVLAKSQLAQGRAAESEATWAESQRLWRGDFDSITVEAI